MTFIASLPQAQRPRIIFDDGYDNILTTAFPIMEKYGLKGEAYIISGYIGKKNDWDLKLGNGFSHMTADEVRRLHRNGWKIGSHGHRHLALTACSERHCREEVTQSKAILEQVTGEAVKAISFPFGNFNPRVCSIIKESGYTEAISISRPSDDGFVKQSFAVYRYDRLAHLKRKLSGTFGERLRLRCINALSEVTVMMQHVKGQHSVDQ